MRRRTYRPSRPVTDRLHPGVYWALVGLAAWYVFAAWGFARSYYTDYLLVVVTGLIVVAIAIPAMLWRIWRHHPLDREAPRESYRQWAQGELRIWQGRMSAKSAAVEIVLPIAAVAFGLLILGIVNHFAPR